MKIKVFIGLIALGLSICTSCNNTTDGQVSEQELALKEKELELKERELAIKEKEKELTQENNVTLNNPAPSEEDRFLGKWSFNNGYDLMEISKKDATFLVIWTSKADAYQPHEIPCTLVGGKLIGDFYGHKKNVSVAFLEDKKIGLTINPFAAFEPIRNQKFLKVE